MAPHCGAALDVGCGRGILTALVAEHCSHVTGIDLSPAMIAAARTHSAGTPNVVNSDRRYGRAELDVEWQLRPTWSFVASYAYARAFADSSRANWPPG